MIVAEWEGAIIIADAGEMLASDDVVQRVVDRLLEQPADLPASFEDDAGTISDGAVRVKPGDPAHPRAVLRSLTGVRFLLDDGADVEAADVA